MGIPFIKPNPPALEDWTPYLKESYAKSHFSNQGPCVDLLEQRLGEYLSLQYTPTLVCNATLGLLTAIKTFSIEDCEVLIPSFTFAATAQAVLWAGCTPVFVDIDTQDWHMDLDSAGECLTENTGAMIVVQSLGLSCDYKKYEDFAQEHGLVLIFDSAPSLGALYPDGTKMGSAGDCEVFSLHVTKSFGMGEGGLITSKSEGFLTSCKKVINFGLDQRGMATTQGINAKMSDFSAAVGLGVLDCFRVKMQIRRSLASEYVLQIETRNLPIQVQNSDDPSCQTHQVFPVLFENHFQKVLAMKCLAAADIGFREYYIPLHTHPAFFPYRKLGGNLQNTDEISERLLCLPLFETMSYPEVEQVVRVLEFAH